MLWLDESLRGHIPSGREFEFVFALEGEVFRAQKNRRMIRCEIGGRRCFVKTHRPASWREILKNAARGRWPTLTAEPEFRAIERCTHLGIPTVQALGFGVRGTAPAALESFIITADLPNHLHLDELPGLLRSLDVRQRVLIQRAAIRDVAAIARDLHRNGLNHRDFYLNHFMLPQRDWRNWNGEALNIRVIDLHRMQMRRHTPVKWAIKDISGLLFSAFDADLTSRDWLRFLDEYWPSSWRECWSQKRTWRWRVMRRAVSLYRSERGRPPPLRGVRPSSA